MLPICHHLRLKKQRVVCYRNDQVVPHREVAVDPLAWQISIPESLANNKDGLTIRETHAHLLPFVSQRQTKEP